MRRMKMNEEPEKILPDLDVEVEVPERPITKKRLQESSAGMIP